MRTIPARTPLCPAPKFVGLSLLEDLFDHVADVAFFVKDAEGRYLTVNESVVARHGLATKSQVIGRRPRDICPGDFGGVPSRQDAAVLRTGKPIIEHLELHWYAPQKPGWCLTTKLPIRDGNGRVTGLIGISRDVRAVQTPEVPATLAAALNRFEADPAVPITPAGLARWAGVPPHRFARLMKRLFGVTPSQFIAKTRITLASRLLRDSDQSIASIAQACGFYDHSAFARAFRKLTGATPSHARGGGRSAGERG